MAYRLTSDEVLAIARLRQWRADKTSLRSPRTPKRDPSTGWGRRNETIYDAALVRRIDFERALARLDPKQQTALVLLYGERQGHEQVAAAIGCSLRTVPNLAGAGLRNLVDVLDRLDLL